MGILALFQKSVLNTISQDESKVALRWAEYQKFLVKVDAIKGFKEEEYQDGFFKDVFENCLGYTLKTTNPSNFNLEREKKNETDGKKADGVIYVDGNIIGVVELKDQKTKHLDSIEAQAFNYHNSHSNSKYVIISNFDELRFYIDKKTAYEKFNLFSLSYEEFKKLHLLLSLESIKENIPQKLKDKSTNFEQSISKELYKDFTLFRTHLFENIIANNPHIDKSLLLRLTQKLCDRVIFILFAEDRGLLRHNTIKEIREEFTNQRFTDYKLYDIFKFYFEGINTGNAKLNITKYNGGLFATDELLDSLIIDDVCLNENAQKLSNYDFVSDISVNILGHIFEQSLSDLEELNASLNDLAFDKKNSKRKKDGVFYTPEYITRYIVENTLGKLCEEQKEALHVKNVEPPKNSKKPTKEETKIKENLELYKNWLLHVKILDPACGSGAFLNQALEYLIKEHKELQEKLVIMGDITAYYDVEASILEHNLYGVDINEDAVEIARLSLWLRTAQQGRALANLSGKIKCGNSLIDDKTVAENAFVWEEEFPEVFANGGFDVVIGNPPYVSTKQISKNDREFYWKKYKELLIAEMDLYEIFLYENLSNNLSKNGMLSFITPNSYYTNKSFENLRKYLILNTHILQIIDFPYRFFPFDDVNTETSIIVLQKKVLENSFLTELCVASKDKLIKQLSIDSSIKINRVNILQNEINNSYDNKIVIGQSDLLNRILKCDKKFGDYLELHKGWMSIPTKTHLNDKIINKGIFTTDEIKQYNIKEKCQQFLEGKNIHRYFLDKTDKYVNIDDIDKKTKSWHFSKKIILQRIVGQNKSKIFATYDEANYVIFPNANLVNCLDNNYDIKFFLAILNSCLLSYFYSCYFGESNTNITKLAFENLPIKDVSAINQKPFVEKANVMLELNRQLQLAKQSFLNELKLEKIPKKLENFDELKFDEFVTEYQKAKKLKFTDKLEERTFKNNWNALFENDKTLTCNLKTEITKTDKEIDAMVYELYGLSEDEIAIVEGKK